jgi:hypothetical protein
VAVLLRAARVRQRVRQVIQALLGVLRALRIPQVPALSPVAPARRCPVAAVALHQAQVRLSPVPARLILPAQVRHLLTHPVLNGVHLQVAALIRHQVALRVRPARHKAPARLPLSPRQVRVLRAAAHLHSQVPRRPYRQVPSGVLRQAPNPQAHRRNRPQAVQSRVHPALNRAVQVRLNLHRPAVLGVPHRVRSHQVHLLNPRQAAVRCRAVPVVLNPAVQVLTAQVRAHRAPVLHQILHRAVHQRQVQVAVQHRHRPVLTVRVHHLTRLRAVRHSQVRVHRIHRVQVRRVQVQALRSFNNGLGLNLTKGDKTNG